MFLLRFPKYISTVTSILGLITIGNLILIDSAHSFSITFDNGGFESTSDGVSTGTGSPNSWSTIGDVYTTGTINSIDPTSGSNQAIITTGYIEGNYADPIGNRNDDGGFNFNQSFTNPVSADTNPDADLLQEHFGFNSDAFSISRTGGILTNLRTSKEGSGMYQDFTVTLDPGETSFTVNFDWAYLTNDGSTTLGGDQDFGFWSLGQVNGSTYTTDFSSTEQIEVLKSSSGSSSETITADNIYATSFDYSTNGRQSYLVDNLSAGTYTYRVGFGVVDVDSGDRTSALLLDNFEIQQTVPFEFSPSVGILIFGSIFLGNRIYQRRISK